MYKILYKIISEQGTRRNNEDFALVYPEDNPHLFIVCDGVGGQNKGEIASNLVATTIKTYLEESKYIDENKINEAINKSIKTLAQEEKTNPETKGMATTLTLLAVNNKEAIICWAGDSRVYHFRKNKIIYKTRDHSFVNFLIKAGEITEEEALTHPKRNIITKAIDASTKKLNPSFQTTNIKEGDYFLLCSDGVIEAHSDEELLKIMEENTTIEEKINKIKNNCQQKSKDNYTAILLQIGDRKNKSFFQRLFG